MKRCTLRAVQGEYKVWIDIGGIRKEFLIDTGFTNPECMVGLNVKSSTYRQLLAQGTILEQYNGETIQADGSLGISTIGEVEVQILYERKPFGKKISTYVADGGEYAEDLVGVCFFHQLEGGIIIWNFSGQTMSIEVP